MHWYRQKRDSSFQEYFIKATYALSTYQNFIRTIDIDRRRNYGNRCLGKQNLKMGIVSHGFPEDHIKKTIEE